MPSCRIRTHRDPPSSGLIIAWVKYGPNVTMAEALTQDYVAKSLIANSAADVRIPPGLRRLLEKHPSLRYRLHNEDGQLAAKAIQNLSALKVLTLRLDPSGEVL